ncbi:MAG: hypothetical protein ACRBCT_05980 [Alphaproteobacteria bacterium]
MSAVSELLNDVLPEAHTRVATFEGNLAKIAAGAPEILSGIDNASLRAGVDSLLLTNGRQSVATFTAEAVNASGGDLQALIESDPRALALVNNVVETISPYVQAFADAVNNVANVETAPEKVVALDNTPNPMV